MISYRPDFYSLSDAYSFTHSPYCHICLNNIPLDSNRITITMPNFKYFSLTYLPYRNYKVKIINRHNILANGELWHRYDMKYKMKSGRRNRKLQRHPELWFELCLTYHYVNIPLLGQFYCNTLLFSKNNYTYGIIEKNCVSLLFVKLN